MRRALALLSGGKDSLFAYHIARLQGFDVDDVAVVLPPEDDPLLHHPNTEWVPIVARALGRVHVVRGSKEEALRRAMGGPWEWVVVGALASEYQRLRFNFVAEELGKKIFAPLWHVDPRKVLHMLVEEGFAFLITFAGAYGMEQWLGKVVDAENVDAFLADAESMDIHPCGEGGEYESFVVRSPYFSLRWRGRIEGRYYVLEEVSVCPG